MDGLGGERGTGGGGGETGGGGGGGTGGAGGGLFTIPTDGKSDVSSITDWVLGSGDFPSAKSEAIDWPIRVIFSLNGSVLGNCWGADVP